MDIRRALLGDPDARYRLATTVTIAFVFLFVLFAMYWQGEYLLDEAYDLFGSIDAVAPEVSGIGDSHAEAIAYLPAALFAIVVHYHGGGILYTLAAAPVLPVTSALTRRIFAPRPEVLRVEVFNTTFPAQVRLGLAVGVLAVVVGSLLRYWAPPNDRSLVERFFGLSEDRYRALVTIIAAGVLAVVFTPWFYTAYPAYQPFTFAVFGAPVAVIVYLLYRGIVLAWLANAAVVIGHSVAWVLMFGAIDYVVDPHFFVPALIIGTTLGSVGVGAAVIMSELHAIVSPHINIAA